MQFASTLRDRITALSPWKARLILVVSGAASAAALPPLHWIFVLPLTIPIVVWVIEATETKRQAFGAGWWFGLGHFAAGLYWVSLSFLVDIASHGWMAPFAVTGLAAGMALFIGLPALAVRLINMRGPAVCFAFPAFWVLSEWLRSWILTGFPWNLMGTIWTFSDSMIQPAALFGVYGLSLVTLLAAAAPAALAWKNPSAKTPLALAVAILALSWGWGTWRLDQPGPGDQPGILLRIVQPNIAQADKWRNDLRPRHVRTLLDMSQKKSTERPTHIVWPETAVPYFINRESNIRQAMAAIIAKGGAILTGAPSATPTGAESFKVWNSIVAIDGTGTIVAKYDKAHLVPFGEYVPFRSFLPIEKLTAGRADFTPGPTRTTLSISGLPSFSPLICYEAIFPTEVVQQGNRPEWLLNVTNDGWFGLSSGPYQHFASARLRAVEEGLPLVRAANTGISAIVDSKGRITSHLPLGISGILDAPLPKPLTSPPLFSRTGATIPLILCALFLLLSYGLNYRDRKRLGQA